MSAIAKQRMTVDQFLAWAEGREGRYELEAGEVIAMSPQRIRHADVKFGAQKALERAIGRAGLPCFLVPDGLTVRVDNFTAYEPDAQVYCGPRLGPDDIEVKNPVVIVEVLSPSTRAIDTGAKLSGYFRVPSVAHYLVVDPVRELVIHHKRGAVDLIETRIVSSGEITLDPPGLTFDTSEFFAGP